MLLLVMTVKLVAEIALMALLSQWLLGLLAGAKRETNMFYKLLQVLTSPFVKVTRMISPRFVLDRHVPLGAFLLLTVVWFVAVIAKINLCLQLGPGGLPMTAGRLAYWRLKLQAMGFLLAGRRDAAHASFSRMLVQWPNDAYALASRAHLCSQMGRPEAALADAQALTAAHPARSAGDWFNFAYLLDQAGRLDEAEAAFRRALALDPKLDRAWYGLGLVLIRLRRFDDAVAALKRNTELQPMSPYGWYQLARLHVDRQDPDEARRIIGHLKGFEPKFAAQLERETGLKP